MGCANSKSTPVVDSIASGTNDLKENANGLLKKGKGAVKEMADDVSEMGHDVSQKISALTDKLRSSQPNTPETERAQRAGDANDEECEQDDGEANGSPNVPVRILSIDLDEDNKDELRDNQLPVKVSLSIGDSDNEAGGEKPPTPMPEDDCLNERGGDRNECTCTDDESDSETYFDTMRTRKSQEDDEDACCAESVELNFDDNTAGDDDYANQSTLCSDGSQSEDAGATGDQKTCKSQENDLHCCANAENGADSCGSEENVCACNDGDECEDSGEVCSDGSATCEDTTRNDCHDDDQCACDEADNCADDNDCLDDNECGGKETDACADDEECAAGESEHCGQTGSPETNAGTLQSECSYRSGDGNSCLNGGSTMKCPNCATAINTMRSNGSAQDRCDDNKTNTIYSQSSAKSAQCCCAGDTSTLQSKYGQGGCACDTMRSGYSCASEESCAADALCADCTNQMGTTKSNYSESTVRSNSFECLSVASDAGQSAANMWGKMDTYQSGYNASSNQQGSCLVCMGTGTVRSRSAYADTMDSSYSQQYGNCAMQSTRSAYATRAGTTRSQGSDSESDSEGDAKGSAPCFNICSCLGQNLIQLQLR